MQEFHEATYLAPKKPDGYYNLAATHHRIGTIEDSESDLKRSEDLYHQSLEQDDTLPDCHRGLAVLLAQQGREDEARHLLESWADREQDDPEAKTELARFCLECGDCAHAKEHLAEALAIDPDNDRAWRAIGKIHEDLGEHAPALAAYERSLSYNRFQPQVASRVSALRSTVTSPLSITVPEGGTRMVERKSTSLR